MNETKYRDMKLETTVYKNMQQFSEWNFYRYRLYYHAYGIMGYQSY